MINSVLFSQLNSLMSLTGLRNCSAHTFELRFKVGNGTPKSHNPFPLPQKNDFSPSQRDQCPQDFETLEEVLVPGYEPDRYIKEPEDASEDNSEPESFNWISKSDPFPPHFPRLIQLDRHEWESCAVGGTKVLMPHRADRIPRHMTQKFIGKLAGCDQDAARRLLDCFIVLEATEQMVKTFCQMSRERGADSIIDYLWRFVIGIVEAEAPSDAMGPYEREPEPELTMGPRWALEDLFRKDSEPQEIQFVRHEYGETEGSVHYEWTPQDNLDLGEPAGGEGEASTVAYHVLEDLGRRQQLREELQAVDPFVDLPGELDELEALWFRHCGWMARQPRKFQLLVKSIRRTESLPQLGVIGKALYDERRWNRDQTAVLWTEYRQRRKQLERAIPYSTTTLAILKRIEVGKNLGTIGRQIWRAQHGELKVKPMPSPQEFKVLWDAWRTAKAANE